DSLSRVVRQHGDQSRRLVPAVPAVHQPAQPARRQWRLHLSRHARSHPARLALSDSLQPDRAGLLGADVDRGLQGPVAAAAQSLLLGEDGARCVALCRSGDRRGQGCGAVTRALASAPLALAAFVAALALAAAATRSGIVPDEAVALWAGAIAAASGEVSLGGIVATYPTLPFLSTTLLKALAPAAAPAPALLGAGVVGLLAGLWFRRLADAGLAAPAAGAATLLLAL